MIAPSAKPSFGPAWILPIGYRGLSWRPTASCPPVRNEMSIYYGQHDGQKTAHLLRCTLRIDGFASLNASFAGGEMVTKPLVFTGHQLAINYSTSAAGGLRIEIQEANGRPIPGYALADCPEIIGDQIERVVAWTGGSDLSKLAGRAVRLRVTMKDADLYSLQFQSR